MSKINSIILLVIGFCVLASMLFLNKDTSISEFMLGRKEKVMVEYIVTNFDNQKSVDTKLLNANGVEFGHSGRVWVNGSDESIVYNKGGEIVKTKNITGGLSELRVKVDASLSGLLFSPGHKFKKDAFIFPTLDGKVYGWHKGDDGIEPLVATERFSLPTAKFTSITSIENDAVSRIYLADFKNNQIMVLDDLYKPVQSPLENSFQDENIPADYAPYVIKSNQENIFVVYVKKDIENKPVACHGCALVNVYSSDGKFIRRLIESKELNLPSAIVFPTREIFGFKNTLLVANQGDGKIHLFDLRSGKYLKSISNSGKDLVLPGINSLSFGTGNGAGSMNDLFFTSHSENKSIYGKITLPSEEINKIKNNDNDFFYDSENKERLNVDKSLLFERKGVTFEETINNLQSGCISPEKEENYLYCLEGKLGKKILELEKLKTKIIKDLEILEGEFSNNPEGMVFAEQNLKNLMFIRSVNTEVWFAQKEKECRLQLVPNYKDEALEKSVKLCLYKATEDMLMSLYIIRADWIRYYVSDGSPIKKPVTEKFKALREEEEFRANNSY